MRTETVGFCFVWSKGVMKPSAFVMCDGKVYWNCQVLSYVQGRRTWSCRVLCCVVGSCSEAVGSCVVWWEGVLTPSRVLRCVRGRRTEAVGSCVVWLEGVLKLSGHVHLYLWVLSCIQGRRTEAVGSWVVYREGDWKLSGLVCLYSLKQLKLFSRKPTQANKKNMKIIIHSSIGKTTKITW